MLLPGHSAEADIARAISIVLSKGFFQLCSCYLFAISAMAADEQAQAGLALMCKICESVSMEVLLPHCIRRRARARLTLHLNLSLLSETLKAGQPHS